MEHISENNLTGYSIITRFLLNEKVNYNMKNRFTRYDMSMNKIKIILFNVLLCNIILTTSYAVEQCEMKIFRGAVVASSYVLWNHQMEDNPVCSSTNKYNFQITSKSSQIKKHFLPSSSYLKLMSPPSFLITRTFCDSNISSYKSLSTVTKSEYLDIEDMLNWCDKNRNRFSSKVEGEEVVFLIGNTQAGKSTVFSYLLGKNLIIDDKQQNGLESKLIAENASDAIIGTGEKSCTFGPNIEKIEDKQPPLVLCDLPGFIDSRSAMEAFKTAYMTKVCIERAKKRKFIFVVSEPMFLTNAGKELQESEKMVRSVIPAEDPEKYTMVLLTRSHYRSTEKELNSKLQGKTNGSILKPWLKNPSVHLPAAGTQGNDGERYSPLFRGSSWNEGDKCLYEYILSEIGRVKFHEGEIDASKYDYKDFLKRETAEEIERLCAKTLLYKLWDETQLDVKLDMIKENKISTKYFLETCAENVKKKSKKDRLFNVLWFLSSRMANEALRINEDNVRKIILNDENFIHLLEQDKSKYLDEKTTLNNQANMVTGAWTAIGVSAVGTSILTYSGLATITAAASTVAAPAILAGAAVTGFCYLTGWWDPWATEQATSIIEKKLRDEK